MSAFRTHLVEIDGRSLTDWDEFHSVFAEKFGFPDYYGRNMNAWYDCFRSLPDESTVLDLAEGDVVRFGVTHFQELGSRQPELAEAIIEGTATLNLLLKQARQVRASGGVQYPILGAVALSLSE